MTVNNECTCKHCVEACKWKPGWFLPNEVEGAAKHLNMTLQDFFNQYLGVDWWEGVRPVFVLAPAIVGEDTGSEYPGNPRGQCVFLNSEHLCDIHPVKPFECSELSCGGSGIWERYEKVSLAWKNNQDQIVGLLGRKPKTEEYQGGVLSGFGI